MTLFQLQKRRYVHEWLASEGKEGTAVDYSRIYFEGLRKATRNLSHDSR